MENDGRSVVVAYDGSREAQAAVRAAAGLFRDRRLLVVSVWEPGIAMVGLGQPDPMGMTPPLPTPDEIATVDRIQHDHAGTMAEAGARLARDLGADAEALPVADETDVAETVHGIAEQRDAAAIVVGSRGLGGMKARLLGSTSRRLLHDTRRPLLVVRCDD